MDVRERDLVGRRGAFVVEGEVVLRALARSRLHKARAILIAESRAARLEPLLSAFGEETPVYLANQDVMDRIAGFHIHRGVLAIGERSESLTARQLIASLAGPAVIRVLMGVSNHDNVGGLFRNAAALGARAVLLDASCCDPLYRKAIRVSVGASLLIPFARLGPGEDAIELLETYGFAPLALSPTGATLIDQLSPPKRAALLLGSEGHGLPAQVLARCPTVSIAMAEGFDSLNVATAGGIALHHLARRRATTDDRHRAGGGT